MNKIEWGKEETEYQLGDLLIDETDREIYIFGKIENGGNDNYNYVCISLQDGISWTNDIDSMAGATRGLKFYKRNVKITLEDNDEANNQEWRTITIFH